MEFSCAKCNAKLEKENNFLFIGCTKCGSKVFKTKAHEINDSFDTIESSKEDFYKLQEELKIMSYEIMPRLNNEETEEKRKKELEDDNIPTIKLKEKGVYEVNLEGLFKNKNSDPIILSGKSGIYKVEIIPTNKKK